MSFNSILNANVKVFAEGNVLIDERLAVCSGVIPSEDSFDGYNERKYQANSFKPKADWRPLTIAEQQHLLGSDPALNYKKNVGLFQLPTNLQQLLHSLHLDDCETLNEAKKVITEKKALFASINSELNAFIRHFFLSESGVQPYIHGIFYNKPGLETIGSRNNNYTGLHIDNGHALKIDRMDEAPNRICINLGKEDRYLLFIPKTASEMLDFLDGQIDIDVNSYKEYQLVQNFLALNPDIPVIKLRQKPFEFYIAPTDNIIHDGCTIGMSVPDVSLVLIGDFLFGMQEAKKNISKI